MGHFFQPTTLMPLSVVVIALGAIISVTVRKMREKELQFHQDLRIREMEHERKMKELEVELARARQNVA